MALQTVKVLITDLDNTLFDWVRIWHVSFSAMLDELVKASGVDREILIAEIKQIHQKRRTAEYSFLIQELPSLQALHPGVHDISPIYRSAVDAFRAARKEVLACYPDVIQTLAAIRAQGTIIVGYTESMAFQTNYRMRKLALEFYLDYLYSPPDHAHPDGMDPATLRKYDEATYKLKITEHRLTPEGELKPNPRLLLQIIHELGLRPDDCVYVGDSLMKDVAMANQANVMSVHARYGESHQATEYELLKQVTHWTDADVALERSYPRGIAKVTLQRSFAELLLHFNFVNAKVDSSTVQLSEKIAVWEKVIDVQQHFNDLGLKVRGLAVTVLGAILTAAMLSIKEKVALAYDGHLVSASVPIILVGLLTWCAFYFMDRWWYHRYLKSAVEHGRLAEDAIRAEIPFIGLTGSIKTGSTWLKMDSSRRLSLFYAVGALVQMLIAFIILVALPVQGSVEILATYRTPAVDPSGLQPPTPQAGTSTSSQKAAPGRVLNESAGTSTSQVQPVSSVSPEAKKK